MQTYTDNVVDRAGNTLGGAQVTVYLADGTTKATLPANPITTGDNGEFSFALANGKYVVSVSHPLIATKTESVYLFDPTDSTLPTTDEKAGIAGLSAADPAVPSSKLVHEVATIADLRLEAVTAGKAIQPLGYYAAVDGGGGPVRVGKTGAAPGTYVDNGGSIIVPTGGDGSAAWVWAVGNRWQILISKNGIEYAAGERNEVEAAYTGQRSSSVSAIVSLAAGDILTARQFHNNGVAVLLDSAPTGNYLEIWAT